MVAPPPPLHAAMHFGRQSPGGHPREEEEESSVCFPTNCEEEIISFSRETDLCYCTRRVFQPISGSRHEPISHHRRTVGGGQGLQQVRERACFLFFKTFMKYTLDTILWERIVLVAWTFFS